MIEFVLGVVAGMVIGWNFMSQPAFMKRWMDKMMGRETEK